MNRQLVVRPDHVVRDVEQSIGLSLDRGHGPQLGSIRRLLSAMRRRRVLFCAVLAAVVIVAVIAALLTTPTFTATARIIFDPRPETVVNVPNVVGDLTSDPAAIDSQIEVIKSRAMVSTVVEKLHLLGDPEFDIPQRASLLQRAAQPAAQWLHGVIAAIQAAQTPNGQTPNGESSRLSANEISLPTDLTRWLRLDQLEQGLVAIAATGDDGRIEREQAVADRVAANLDVRSVGLSSVIQISFRSKSPAKAVTIATVFVDTYIADQLAAKMREAARVAEGLRVRLDQLRHNADDSDAALREYQVSHHLVGLQSATGATSVQQEIGVLTQELSKAQADEAAAQARLDVANSNGRGGDSFGDALNSPVIQALKKQRAAASALVAQVGSRYGSASVEMISAQRALADVDGQIRAEVSRVRQSLAGDLRVAQTTAASIQARLQTTTEALKDASIASVSETQLRSRAEADRAVYQSFLNRFAQISALNGMERADARVISRASTSGAPNLPGRKLIVMVGFLIGCATAVAAVSFVEFRSGGIYEPNELMEDFGLRWLGSIPELSSIREPRSVRRSRPRGKTRAIDVPVTHSASTYSEMLRGVLVSDPFDFRAHRQSVVMLTSALPGEGKTTTAISLARTLALQGVIVLLVDCDLRWREATRLLGGTERGIADLVNHTARIDEVMHVDESSGMRWIGAGHGPVAPSSIFATAEFIDLLSSLRQQFDIVLLDAAPMLATADARWLAQQADKVVIAARWANTRRSALRATLAVLDDIGAPTAGAILTRVDLRKQRRTGGVNEYSYDRQYQAYLS